jgi:hypothetical protein
MSRRKSLDDRDQELISETIGYLHGCAAILEAQREAWKKETVVTPSAEAYARILAARLKNLRDNMWPVDG